VCVCLCVILNQTFNYFTNHLSCVVVWKGNNSLTLEEMKSRLKNQLAHYKIPRFLKSMKELPRNAMGKLNKKELEKLFLNQ